VRPRPKVWCPEHNKWRYRDENISREAICRLITRTTSDKPLYSLRMYRCGSGFHIGHSLETIKAIEGLKA